MSKRRLRHGGSRLNRGTPYGGFMGHGEARCEHRWKNVMPESWVVVGAAVIHRKTGRVATIAFVGPLHGDNPRHCTVAVYSDATHHFTSGPLSMRAFYARHQRACDGCSKAMDVACMDCNDALYQEQMSVYRGMIGPLESPAPMVDDGEYKERWMTRDDDEHRSGSEIRCGAVVDPYPSR